MLSYETFTLQQDEVEKGVFVLTLNRPHVLNALNTRMGEELYKCLTELKENESIRVLVITGAGQRSFCAGADLKERNGMTNEQWRKQHEIFKKAYRMIREFPYPVIAAVNGYALGGGLELALSADFRLASDNAKFGLPEVTIGIIPGVGGTQLLPRAVPVGMAKEMLFSGQFIDATTAKEIGLVNAIYPFGELMEKTLEKARIIGRNAPLSLKALKKVINNGLQTDINTALEIELQYYYQCASSEDRLEGVRAFNEKRRPQWQGK